MKLSVRHRCPDFGTYRAALVKSLFNAENGHSFELDVDLPIDDDGWRVGLATWEPALDGVPPLWRPELRLIGFPGCAPAAPPPCSGR